MKPSLRWHGASFHLWSEEQWQQSDKHRDWNRSKSIYLTSPVNRYTWFPSASIVGLPSSPGRVVKQGPIAPEPHPVLRENTISCQENRHQYATHPTAYGTSMNPMLTWKASVPPIHVTGWLLLLTNCWRNVYSSKLCTEARLAPKPKQCCCSAKKKEENIGALTGKSSDQTQ